MDIPCPKCGAEWSIHDLHAEAEQWAEKNFTTVLWEFRREGCEALGSNHSEPHLADLASMLWEALGDDVDGVAAEWADALMFGGFDE